VAIVFNCANSFLLPMLRSRGIPTALHVDGLEWQRSKWGRVGKRYYRAAEAFSPRAADALIADARGIQTYYHTRFGAPSVYLPYGAPLRHRKASDDALLRKIGVVSRGYHLVVARQEPENQTDRIMVGYMRSNARLPLVVVGGNPYPTKFTEQLSVLAQADPRIRPLGSVWDQELLDALYANCLSYVHGHSVGGTNPALLRAMGAGAATIAFDVSFNREVCGVSARYFSDPSSIAVAIEEAETSPTEFDAMGQAGRARAQSLYTWEGVADGYERLCLRLAGQVGARPPLLADEE
jgi:glycosyltransferase involved in cell wall biosynthesis